MKENEYISKKEAEKKGYERLPEGIYYKKSILEKYCENGYLSLKNSPYSDEDRCRAGLMLATDYYLGKYNTLQSKQIKSINIRTKQKMDREDVLFYQERYISAMKSIPYEFWKVVRIVCIEDKELRPETEITYGRLAQKNNVYHQKMLLSLGLERLIKYYLKKNKKSS